MSKDSQDSNTALGVCNDRIVYVAAWCISLNVSNPTATSKARASASFWSLRVSHLQLLLYWHYEVSAWQTANTSYFTTGRISCILSSKLWFCIHLLWAGTSFKLNAIGLTPRWRNSFCSLPTSPARQNIIVVIVLVWHRCSFRHVHKHFRLYSWGKHIINDSTCWDWQVHTSPFAWEKHAALYCAVQWCHSAKECIQ